MYLEIISNKDGKCSMPWRDDFLYKLLFMMAPSCLITLLFIVLLSAGYLPKTFIQAVIVLIIKREISDLTDINRPNYSMSSAQNSLDFVVNRLFM